MLYFLLLLPFMYCIANAQLLPPKQAYPTTITQIHSGHSLTDPLFYPNWPGQYVNLMSGINKVPAYQLSDKVIGKSTIPGSSLANRWEKGPSNGAPDARLGIANWELLCITERVPLLYEGGSTQQWYLDGIIAQRDALSLFVNNAWNNGNGGKGAPTLLWTTWVSIDSTNGPFRTMLDKQGLEWEKMQDHANAKRPMGAPPVYLIPGHKMMARIYDDILKGKVPGITQINQLFTDHIHPNELGAYAIAMIHYTCIYNKSPLGLPNNLLPNANASVKIPTKEFAEYVQRIVWEIVTTYERTGIYSTSSAINESYEKEIFDVHSANTIIHVYCIERDQYITISDIRGKILYSGKDEEIYIGDYPSGFYVISNGKASKSFVKH